ncbi:MAG: hypothetical protein R2684_04205 [Pyrinomonadaceae bacterium]
MKTGSGSKILIVGAVFVAIYFLVWLGYGKLIAVSEFHNSTSVGLEISYNRLLSNLYESESVAFISTKQLKSYRQQLTTSDFLDSTFVENYPFRRWVGAGTFELRLSDDRAGTDIVVANRSQELVDFVLIETIGQKVFSFDLELGTERKFSGAISEALSVKAVRRKGDKVLFWAAEIEPAARLEDSNSKRTMRIEILPESVEVLPKAIVGETVRCCGHDRPGEFLTDK